MNQAQAAGMRNVGMIGSGGGSAQAVPERTLAHRLEVTIGALAYYAERLESVLARVNGTPQAGQAAEKGSNTPTPSLPLSSSVENAEGLVKRMESLLGGFERIA